MTTNVYVPPDGSYGWVIVFAASLNYFIIMPLFPTFGLIFKDEFQLLGLSAAQGSLIINVNTAFGMITGVFTGVLLKFYGYRKVSYLGTLMITGGIIWTSFAKSFNGYLISYGLITSLGFGFAFSAYNLAVNTYFTKNRNKAISLKVTLTGFGSIIMPQLINFLINHYDTSGSILIVGGLCAHGFISATLLQPVNRHMKLKSDNESQHLEHLVQNKIICKENPQDGDTKLLYPTIEEENYPNQDLKKTINNIQQMSLEALDFDTSLGKNTLSFSTPELVRGSSNFFLTDKSIKKNKSNSLGTLINIVNNQQYDINIEQKIRKQDFEAKIDVPAKDTSCFKEIMKKSIETFDLDLLRDPVYCSILLGLSLAVFAEMNFSVLTAFILNDLGLNTSEIATCMSVIGLTDLIFRFLAPYIGNVFKTSPRIVYMFTILGLIITRMGFLICDSFYPLIIVSLFLGCAKGIRTVYMALVLPTYVPIEKLAIAHGMQMMINGIFLLIGGPAIGLIRDVTGSYFSCIIVMNIISLSAVVLWTIEILYLKKRKKDDKNVDPINS